MLKIIDWFIPEKSKSILGEYFRCRFLVGSCWSTIVFIILLMLVERFLLEEPVFPASFYSLHIFVLGSIPFALRYAKKRELVGWIFPVFSSFIILYFSFTELGLLNSTMPSILIVPIIALLFAGYRLALGLSIILFFSIFALSYAHLLGFFQTYSPHFPEKHLMSHTFIYAIDLVFMMVLVSFYEKYRYDAQTLLAKSEERYMLALEGTNDGIFDWNLISGEHYLSARFQELLGYCPGTLRTKGPFDSVLFMPIDYEKVQEVLASHLKSGELFSFESRMKLADGSCSWFHLRGGVSIEGGKPVRMTGSIQDISERKKLEILKEEFISNMSHEFRTPLTSIMGSLRLLNQDAAFSSSQKDSLLEIAERNSQRLLKLVNDILDLQKLQAGLVPLSCDWVDVLPLIRESISFHRPLSDKKGISLDLSISGSLKPIWADPGRLHQILGNLLSNAIKFSPEASTVALRVKEGETGILFEVEDHGSGIPLEFQEQLFERFTRWDEANQPQGTGLGLAIAKRIVEAHRGCIYFESVPNEGTRFFVELPYNKKKKTSSSSDSWDELSKQDD